MYAYLSTEQHQQEFRIIINVFGEIYSANYLHDIK